MPRSYQYEIPNVPHYSPRSSPARYSPSYHFSGRYITPEKFAEAIARRDQLASAVALLEGDPVAFAEFVFIEYLCRDIEKIKQDLFNQEQVARERIRRFFQ